MENYAAFFDNGKPILQSAQDCYCFFDVDVPWAEACGKAFTKCLRARNSNKYFLPSGCGFPIHTPRSVCPVPKLGSKGLDNADAIPAQKETMPPSNIGFDFLVNDTKEQRGLDNLLRKQRRTALTETTTWHKR